MGDSISDAVNNAAANAENREQKYCKAQLEMLIELGNSKLTSFEQRLRLGTYSHEFQISEILLKHRDIRVCMSAGCHLSLMKGVADVVSDIVNDEDNAYTIETAVNLGLEAMFTSASGSVAEKWMWCVKLDGTSLCVIDIYMYAYDISSAGLFTPFAQLFVYEYQVSTIATPITRGDLTGLIGMMYTYTPKDISKENQMKKQKELLAVLEPIYVTSTDDEKEDIRKQTEKLNIDG